ncbi:ATP/GTP-binding protein [Peribacillus frigoritolerans]|uniref:AAA family ATPase n=1 Tax=Peribacillus frigoritolerans TaxID=450367 RepID=UPI002E20F1A5|nr:ATP/GTP-binding protein [Peribacillus frigoritolerans]
MTMLMNFKVKNFLSFSQEQEFSMVAGNVRNKDHHIIHDENISILRFAAIYGANASGKSNLLKALDFSKKAIIYGSSKNSKDKYFRLDKESEKNPTTFEYEFKIDNKYYAYGFNMILSEGKFTGEWLYELKKNTESLIYERDMVNKSFKNGLKLNSKDSKIRFKIYSEDLISNEKVLFISEINRNESMLQKYVEFKVFHKIFQWFSNTLDINFPNKPISSTEFFVENNNDTNNKIFKLLDSLDTGITNFELVDSSIEEISRFVPKEIIKDIEEDLLEGNSQDENHKKTIHLRSPHNLHSISLTKDKNIEIKTMYFSHGTKGGNFILGEESDGTRRLLDLLEILLGDEDKVYIIDEIDRSLHPNLTYKFIELFFDVLTDKNIQLIITTHEDRILDLNLLRRDEIWFVEKQEEGYSNLYSLEKFKARFDTKILNAYLEGRYGAIPKFKNLIEVGGED